MERKSGKGSQRAKAGHHAKSHQDIRSSQMDDAQDANHLRKPMVAGFNPGDESSDVDEQDLGSAFVRCALGTQESDPPPQL